MYREVMRRILAIVLAVCMVGSMPDLTLFATEMDGARAAMTFEGVKIEGDEQGAGASWNADWDSGKGAWTLRWNQDQPWSASGGEVMPKIALKDASGNSLSNTSDYGISGYVNNDRPSRNGNLAEIHIAGRGNYAGNLLVVTFKITVSVNEQSLTMPKLEQLGKQSRASLQEGRVSRLTIEDPSIEGDNKKLKQVAKDSEEDGYWIAIDGQEENIVVAGDTVDIKVVGNGVYEGEYTYKGVPVIDEEFDGAVTLSYGQEVITEYGDAGPIFTGSADYTGAEICPDVTVRDADGNELVEGINYTVEYGDENIDASETRPYVMIEGIGEEHVGIKKVPFRITPAELKDIFDLTLPQETVIYNKKKAIDSGWIEGNEVQIPDEAPEVINKKNNNEPANEGDYDLTYAPVDSEGLSGRRYVEVTVNPKGSNVIASDGELLTARYVIEPASFMQNAYPAGGDNYINVEWADGNPPSFSYGDKMEPEVTVTQNVKVIQNGEERIESAELAKGEDYSVEFSETNSVEDGGTVTIVPGSNGNYTGERELTFNIKALNLRDLDISKLNIPAQAYTGQIIKPGLASQWIEANFENGPSGIRLEEGKDYYLDYPTDDTNKNVGMGQVIIRAKENGGSCVGSKAVPFLIYKRMDLNDKDITIEIPDQQYTGGEIKPEPIVKRGGQIVENTENYTFYTCEYNNSEQRVEPGSYTVYVWGDGTYYVGMKEVTFKIVPRKIGGKDLKAEYNESYSDSVTAKKSVYSGSAHEVPEEGDIRIFIPAANDDEKDIELKYNDFQFEWTNSRGVRTDAEAVGDYKLKITPKDLTRFASGSLTLDYKITSKSIVMTSEEDQGKLDHDIELLMNGNTSLTVPYTGKVYDNRQSGQQKIDIQMTYNKKTLTLGTDYTIQFQNDNTNAGTAHVTITGRGNFEGSYVATFTIEQIPVTPEKIANGSAKVAVAMDAEYTYTGGPISPKVTGITVNGLPLQASDYEIVPDETAIDVGEYGFGIRFKGNYSSVYPNPDDKQKTKDVIDTKEHLGLTYKIVPKSIGSAAVIKNGKVTKGEVTKGIIIESILNQVYTGSEIKPQPGVTDTESQKDDQVLVKDTDYTLDYENNINVDAAGAPDEDLPSVIITGTGNYSGTVTVLFHICETDKDISNLAVQWPAPDDFVYNGWSHIVFPEAVGPAESDGTILEEKRLTQVEFHNTGSGGGDFDKNADGSYSSKGDYIVEWKGNVNAGKMQARVVGVNEYGGCTEWQDYERNIVQADISTATAIPRSSSVNMDFTGSSRVPDIIVRYTCEDKRVLTLDKGKDYTVAATPDDTNAQNNIALTVTGQGNFTGTIDVTKSVTNKDPWTYNIQPRPLRNVTVADFDIETLNLDWAAANFENDIADVIKGQLALTDPKRLADGAAVTDDASGDARYELKADDYDLEFEDLTDRGVVKATFTGKKNYTGTITKEWQIPYHPDNFHAQIAFDDATGVENGLSSFLYNGSMSAGGVNPNPKITITGTGGKEYKGNDYAYTVTDGKGNIYSAKKVYDCGTYTVEFKGKAGTPLDGFVETAKFVVVPRDLNDEDVVKVTMPSDRLKYTGSNRWPNSGTNKSEITLQMVVGSSRQVLVEDKDFKIVPQENGCWQISDDPYTVKIEGMGNFAGSSIEREYYIVNNFEGVTVTVSGHVKTETEEIDGQKETVYVFDYTGGKIVPGLTVKDGSKTLAQNIDYYIDYGTSNCKNVSSKSVELTLRGLGKNEEPQNPLSVYCGEKKIRIRVQPRNLSRTKLEVKFDSYTYDYGNEIRPKPEVVWKRDGMSDVKLTSSDIYFEYSSNIAAGTGYLTIKGAGNFTGTYATRFPFAIQEKDLGDEDVAVKCANPDVPSDNGNAAQYFYTGKPLEPEFEITWGDGSKRKLKSGDYTVTYAHAKDGEGQHTNTGTVTATIEGKGNYKGTISCEFEIVRRNLSGIWVELEGQDEEGKFLYTGNKIEPAVTVGYIGADGEKEVMDQDIWEYQVEYRDNVDVGEATVVITVDDDNPYINFDKSVEEKFIIDPRPIQDKIIEITPDPIGVQLFDPDTDINGVWPEIAVINTLSDSDLIQADKEGDPGDYYVLCENNMDCTQEGQFAYLTVYGQGNYAGESVPMPFEIKRDLTKYISVSIENAEGLVYDGTEIKPELTVEPLKDVSVEDITYSVAYEGERVDAGKYRVIVKGEGMYAGEISLEFEILPLDIADSSITCDDVPDYIYNGSDIAPDVTVRHGDTLLANGQDYIVTEDPQQQANVKEPGDAVATLAGINNYTGTRPVPFKILNADIDEDNGYILAVWEKDQVYTGDTVIPEIKLYDNRRNSDGSARIDGDVEVPADPKDYDSLYYLLGADDYRIKEMGNNVYPNADETDVDRPFVTLEGLGHYAGNGEQPSNRTFKFNIKVPISNAVITLSEEDREYDGTEFKPNLEVTLDGVPLAPGTDYTIDYGEDCVNAGTHTIKIKGNGGYMGEATTEFTILPRDMSHVEFTVEGVHEYTGSAVMPTVVGRDEGLNLPLRAQDVVITAESNVDPGTAVLTVAPAKNGNYVGDSKQLTFEILKADLANDGYIQVTVGSEPEYTGGPVVPELTLKDTRRNADGFAITEADGDNYYTLVQERDYKIAGGEGTDHVNPGAASVTLEGSGNYRGMRTIEFTIRSGLANAVIEIAPQVYDGTRHTPELSVTLAGKTLEPGKDYTVSFDGDRINAGTYSVTIEGTGDYHGSKTQEFAILPRDISHVSFTVEGEYVYNGSAMTPLVYGVDEEIGADRFVAGDGFEITSENMVDAGEKMLNVTAVEGSNYTGTKEVPFEILRANIENEYVQVSIERETRYTGEPVTPEIILTDTRRNSAGEFITAREDGHYRLKEDTDYRVTYTDHTYPGKVSVAITGTGNYRGLLDDVEYVIIADLAQADIAPIPSQAYNGEPIKPELTVTLGDMPQPLVLGEDYTVTYADNMERGTATATIHAVAGSFYDGQKTASFRIGRGIGEAEIQLISSSFPYTGREVAPVPAIWLNGIRLQANEDYTVRYENNVRVGTAAIIVTGIGEYGGEARMTFEISPRNIIRCSFTNISDRVYSGEATSQDLVVTDDEFGRTLQYGVDYTLEYFNNVNPGVATVRVSGRGNYGGVKTVFYVINVQDMATVSAKGSANSVTVQWDPVFGAEGYAVYDMANNLLVKTPATSFKQSNLNALTTYSYRVVPYMTSDGATYYGGSSGVVTAKTSIQKPAVTLKAGKKKATVSWKKIKGVTGYVVYRSTKKTKGYKKIKTIKGDSTVKYINKKLTGKKKYYYKVRAYKRVNGSNVYSKYSSPKSVKAK